ncbi:MAG: hypothetical protein BJ554DRAFT_2986, partial [Olpidium bornovanus]
CVRLHSVARFSPICFAGSFLPHVRGGVEAGRTPNVFLPPSRDCPRFLCREKRTGGRNAPRHGVGAVAESQELPVRAHFRPLHA